MLYELRQGWEKGLSEICVIPILIDSYHKVFVILKSESKDYRLHRYFVMAGTWAISVDLENCSLERCIEHISKDRDLRDAYLDFYNTFSPK